MSARRIWIFLGLSIAVGIVLLVFPATVTSQEGGRKARTFKGPLEPKPLVSVSCPLLTTDRAQISKMLVKKGDYVVRGQLLAQLDDREAYLRFIQSVVTFNDRSTIRSAESVVVLRDAELRRFQELIKKGAASREELDLAKAQRAVAIASLQQEYAGKVAAAMTMQYQAKQLADRLVLSPLSGVVVQIQLDEGEVAQGGAPIVDIVDLDTVFVRLDPDIELIGQIKAGDKAQVVLDIQPDKTYEGVVDYVSPVADAAAGTFQVRVALKTPVKMKHTLKGKVYNLDEVEEMRMGKAGGREERSAAFDTIVQALKSKEGLKSGAKVELACALAAAGDERALPGLAEAIRKAGIEERAAAARALGHIRTQESVDLLIKALDDRSSDVRWWAQNSLSMLGRIAVPKLAGTVRNGSENASRGAASALAQIVSRNSMSSAIDQTYLNVLESIRTGYADPKNYVLKYDEKDIAQRDYEVTAGLYAEVTFPHLDK